MVRSTAAATASALPASSAPLARTAAVLLWSMSCTTSLWAALARLRAIGPPMAPSPMNPTLPAMLLSAGLLLEAARDVDGEARDEVGVGRGEETDQVGLVGGPGDGARGGAFDLLGLRGLRALVPMRADALRQGDAGRDGVDVDAVGPELEGELAGEGDDAALGRGIGAGAVEAQAPSRDRGQVDDLAAALLLHHRNDRVRAEEGGVEVEGDKLLPVGEAQLLGRRLRIGDHRAAAHGVDQDVDAAVVLRPPRDQTPHLLPTARIA